MMQRYLKSTYYRMNFLMSLLYSSEIFSLKCFFVEKRAKKYFVLIKSLHHVLQWIFFMNELTISIIGYKIVSFHFCSLIKINLRFFSFINLTSLLKKLRVLEISMEKNVIIEVKRNVEAERQNFIFYFLLPISRESIVLG